jgi:hypothetical protein
MPRDIDRRRIPPRGRVCDGRRYAYRSRQDALRMAINCQTATARHSTVTAAPKPPPLSFTDLLAEPEMTQPLSRPRQSLGHAVAKSRRSSSDALTARHYRPGARASRVVRLHPSLLQSAPAALRVRMPQSRRLRETRCAPTARRSCGITRCPATRLNAVVAVRPENAVPRRRPGRCRSRTRSSRAARGQA